MSIQNMIDATPSGGTVSVPPGTYFEQLVINKPLILKGPDPAVGEAIVDATGLEAVPTLLITSSEVTVKFMVFQNGPSRGICIGTTTFPNLESVVIDNCIVRGHDLSGIINITGSAVDIINSLIENNGAVVSFERAGVFLKAHGKTNIINNTIRHNSGDGLYADGRGDGNAGLLVKNNIIEDESFSGITLAWDEREVTISGNTIRNCGLGTSDLHGGIVIIQSMAETIEGNIIMNCKQRGIMWGWVPQAGPKPDEILISGNQIYKSSHDALSLFSQGPGSFIPPDPFPLEPLVSDNFLHDNGNAGVFISNQFSGSSPGNANPHVECNSLQNNSWGVFNQTATIINAVNNWWGDSSGPFHPVKNPDGLGNPVSDRVDFIPWKIKPPLPPPTEIVCIKAKQVYESCRVLQAGEEVADLDDLVTGQIHEIRWLDAELVIDAHHPFKCEKILNSNRVQLSFFYRYKFRWFDDTGEHIFTSAPVSVEKVTAMSKRVRHKQIQPRCEVFLKCLECFVSNETEVTCCIGQMILFQLVANVQLRIPAYGFCSPPGECP
ncbi:MAG: right-handed parallel beta-helix repeat-containing protein [Bacillota bacterium]|nr:right-handed parallel beta-helix repeat-containing protein [Bacillota bacterium]